MKRPHEPPFETPFGVPLAFVDGHYQAPSGKKLGPRGFLALYIARRPSRFRFRFVTYDYCERYVAYSVISSQIVNVEFGLIRGWLDYEVTFEQWRPILVDDRKRSLLKKWRLQSDYTRAQRALGAVLFRTRMPIYRKSPNLLPLFKVKARSHLAIRRDRAEKQFIEGDLIKLISR